MLFVTVSQLAKKVNNLERFTIPELKHDIIKISVFLTNSGRNIEYYIDKKDGSRETYTEKTIPAYIYEIMNKQNIVYHEKKTDGTETFIYSFI